jgi:hypothetical protein
MENGLYEEALQSAINNSDLIRENSVLEVGKRLINHLIEKGDFESAANYLPEVSIKLGISNFFQIKVCTKHKTEWEFFVNEFERHHQVLKLVPVIPTKDPQLEPENYESILIAALYSRPKLFHAIVSHWDADIYRAGYLVAENCNKIVLASLVAEVFKRITADNANKAKLKSQKDPSIELLSDQDRIYLLRALASLLLQCR